MSNGSKTKSGSAKTARRREELRRTLPKQTYDIKSLLQRPEFFTAAMVTLGFFVVLSAIMISSRDRLMVQVGQVMTDTRLNRLDYRVADLVTTDLRREEAGKSAPHVYTLNTLYLDRLAASLNGLPIGLAGKTSLEEISPELKEEFQLSEAGLRALASFAVEGETTRQWRQWVDDLTRVQLPANPLIRSDDFQNYWVFRRYTPKLKRLLQTSAGETTDIPRDAEALEMKPDAPLDLQPRLQQIVHNASFPAEVVTYISAKLAYDAKPTIVYDSEATLVLATEASEAEATVFVEHHSGDVIYRRGDTLTLDQYGALHSEAQQFAAGAGFGQRWLPRVAIIGLMAIVSIFLVGYTLLFYPRITQNPVRLFALCTLVAGMLGLSALVGAKAPSIILLAAVAPTIFVAIVALLAYDQRLALFISALQSALTTLALGQSVGLFILLFAGCGAAVAQLREMRHRSTIIQASAITAAVLAFGGVLLGMLEIPTGGPGAGWEPWRQILFNGFWAGFAGFAVGFVVLGILPTIEKWFDITTGMTLAELRDPKRPLLKQLQQKAPGTYNHSLQVANISEAATEAIGANGLLVYVGALYHDIGKMNKPEYFVENQAGGVNRHDKLSPAMSLLVIVGHVKDGIELGREYGLPRQIQHFIESHHGTTLVEYFYHAAKSKSEDGNVQEVEFRYPGPKPRTKEAAILMLADAVESATRSMADPNPARIDGLVKKLSRKRLTDGQYDQCDLTFRELGLIEASMIKSLCAIYHGRISYPSQKEEEKKETAAAAAPAPSPTPEPVPAKQASA